MDKTYTIFKDKTGMLPTEHRITYTIRNPHHEKYRFADVSFCFDPELKALKRLDFFVDEKLLFVNLAVRNGVASYVWYFQKMGSYQKITDEEIDFMLLVAKDVLGQYPKMPKGFREAFEVLPRQANVYKKIFDKNTNKSEKTLLVKALREKNYIIKSVQFRYRTLVSRQKSQVLNMGE